jgi:hypothetical protein
MFDVQCLSESLDVDTEGMQGITLQRIADLVMTNVHILDTIQAVLELSMPPLRGRKYPP